MDMGSDSSGGGSMNGFMPLSSAGVDFTNETQAFNFLQNILDDSYFQIVGNQYATYFWYGVVVYIGLAAAVNFAWKAVLDIRVKRGVSGSQYPARPDNVLTKTLAALTAIARESTYMQFAPRRFSSWIVVPSFGQLGLCLLYFSFLLALTFANNDYPGAQHEQAIGLRAGWVAVAQLPLLILLASKSNIIGFLTGTSYERLSVYHRWVSRGLLMLASMHFGFQMVGWNEYGLVTLEWNTDTCPPTGMAAYAILLWMNLTTLAPFRKMSYGIFVVQHLLTFFGLIIALMEHLPTTALYSRVYVWIPIGFYLFDRVIRTVRMKWTWSAPTRLSIQALDGVAVKIFLPSTGFRSGMPGGHIRLRPLGMGFWNTHPATVVHNPFSPGEDFCILRARGRLTRKLVARATAAEQGQSESSLQVFRGIHSGPYFSQHNDLAAYDNVVLIAGGTGISFTLSCLLDLAHQASLYKRRLPVRTVRFTWIVRSSKHLHWVSSELQTACRYLNEAGIEVDIELFTTSTPMISSSHGFTQTSDLDANLDEKLAATSTTSKSSDSEDDITKLDKATDGETQVDLAVRHRAGRPAVEELVSEATCSARGESAICVCGPVSLAMDVRNAVARISDRRAVNKGTGAQGIYLHVASLGDM